MYDMVFAFIHPTPDRQAAIVHEDITWPIRTETEAYNLAKRCRTGGFWRIKELKRGRPE